VAPPIPLLAVPNVTAHPPAASVAITVLLYDGPFLCGCSVAVKGLLANVTRRLTTYTGQTASLLLQAGHCSSGPPLSLNGTLAQWCAGMLG